MNKKLAIWIAGGLLTATVFAFGYNTTLASAAEKVGEQKPGQAAMTQMGQYDMSKMSAEDMQKLCLTMMSNPEMQQMMQPNAGMMPMNGNQPGAAQSAPVSADSVDHAAHHPAQ